MKTTLKVLLVIANLAVVIAVLLHVKKKKEEEAILFAPAEQPADGNDAYFSMTDLDSFFGTAENNE